MEDITSIQISTKTREALSNLGTMKDTYETVITMLIEEHNRKAK